VLRSASGATYQSEEAVVRRTKPGNIGDPYNVIAQKGEQLLQYEQSDVFLVWLQSWTSFDSYHADRRFQSFLKRMNFVQ